ncbi:MAG TPA: alpha-L-arabinofuranosidase C-terminal domain-containing protein [Bacteroidales bacterium]|nr:alpha-L-arabinofuranosidase C-terminal domain-containing protein [Bacteroidales bacterium]HOK74101.1 alpha-L-arabinofuranosidase C-terminal domain-containing protein [Bacteroidales bacterium]HOM40481.1 alpha-L-arabinofuranosidase C-terminal domain-containing protein [Bacteroidales bacterium]HOU30419.1 alpha-L-arabinofuranosidase C-terminal domain-containing protein [Bacteroidales bacterium]HPP92569.1 alpha-L-arabinofuranosidase C-terminal domain-containing protein [Bacteroidales bacterium]
MERKKILTLVVLFLGFLTTAVYPQKTGNETVNQFVIVANNPGPVISKDIYGHFSEHLGTCIYGGIWVGPDSKIPNTYGIRNDVLFALREIKVPNLRWPGGCFADTYHWRDGIGPQSKRASIINIHWGGVTEDNSFGTHEFMKLTELLGCDAYINGNVGSGTVQEMAEWVEYLTSDAESPMTRLRKENGRETPWKVRYWAIGNENWGCGGNMTDEFYASVMRQYSTYLNNYGGNRLYKIACGPYGDNFQWTETLMKDPSTRNMFQGISIHYYSVVDGWNYKGSATNFDEREWFETFRLNYDIERIIIGHKNIMDRYDPNKIKGLIVDEWGNWFNVEPGTNPGFLYQQNTLRDAITAAIHLNIFNHHADRVKMANLAQMVNVLQAVILTKDDKMVLTPTYYVFKMFKNHQDARLLKTDLKCENYTYGDKKIPAISASASMGKDGTILITMANLNPSKDITVTCPVIGATVKTISGQVLTAREMNAHNTFENPDNVKPAEFKGYKYSNGVLTINMPAKSVVALELK